VGGGNGSQGEEPGDDVALVVANAAPVKEVTIAAHRKGWRRPEVQRLRRLDVVVVVEEERVGRPPRDLADDHRVAGRLFLQDRSRRARRLQHLPDEGGRLRDRLLLGADGGQGDEAPEQVDGVLEVALDIAVGVVHGAPPRELAAPIVAPTRRMRWPCASLARSP
jgi:hypothetical protein